MFKVIVVDDEPVALQHICSIIEKKCPDYEIAATAENGKEGLEKVRLIQPDLLISDVKMPLMSGIDLVSRVKEEFPEILSIIVSGYSEFEYAKAALQSGVCDYILKPVLPSAMKKTIDAVTEKIKKHYYQERNNIIHLLCNGAECEENQIAHYFSYPEYYGAIVRKNGLPRRFSTANSLEIFSDINEIYTVYGRDEMESLYIIPKELLFGKTFEEYITQVADREKSDSNYVTVVYQKNSFTASDIKKYVKELYRELDTISVVGYSQMVDMEYCEEKKIIFEHDSIHYVLNNFEHLLKDQQNDKIKKELSRLFHVWEEEKKPQLWMEYMARQIMYLVRKYNTDAIPLIECETMMEDAFFYADSFTELLENLFDIMFKYIKENDVSSKVDSPEFFQTIKDYLIKHLDENMSLQVICKKFALSQTYLSKLFRKYENQSFNRYLTEMRMEQATRLMKENPDIFVKDVAAMVGYNDQFYFSRIFRSYTGYSPTNYLEKL
ncbi:MAG: response regulator [Lachnospiraceae bacterium]|nr:response regulator [Lachnospiraceae bacterium]MDD3614647.1 response regulator [Lachnospiraceae bacterium]